MQQDLEARIKQFQNQLKDLSDDEEEEKPKGNAMRISKNIQDLQKQLAGMDLDDDDIHQEQSTSPQIHKLSTISTPIKKVQQPSTTNSHNKSINTSVRRKEQQDKPKQIFVMPSVDQATTLLAIEQLIKLAEEKNDKMFLQEIIARKIKFFSLIDSGRMNSSAYANSLRNKNLHEIKNPVIRESVIREQNLLKKFNNQDEFFMKLSSKYRQSLNNQAKATGNRIQPKQFKSKVVFVPKQLKAAKDQLPLIDGINKASVEKKLQLLLQSMARLECLIEYYKANLPQKKAKQIQNDFLPKMEYAMKLVAILRSKKNVPIAQFYVLCMPKLTFQAFHGFKSKKEFMQGVSMVIEKVKQLLNAQKDFRKLIYRNKQNSLQVQKIDKQIVTYEQDLKYLNDIKMKTFVPLPVFKVYSEEREYFNENKNLQHNDLQLIIKQIEGFESAELKIYFEQSDNPKTSYHIKPGNQNIQLTLKLNQQAVKDITNRSIRLKMQTKSMMMFTKDLMEGNINLSQLQFKNSFQGRLFTNGIKIVYEVHVRLPANKICKSKIQMIRLKRIPEYVCTTQYQREYMKRILFPNSKSDIRPATQIQPKQKPVVNQTKHQSQPPQKTVVDSQPKPSPIIKDKVKLIFPLRNEQVNQKLKTNIPGFPPEMLLQPEIYCDSLNFYTQFDPVLDKATNQLHQYKPNRRIAQDIQDELNKKKIILENKIKNGKLDQQGYVKLLEASLKTDLVLLQLFNKFQLAEFVQFIQARIGIIKQQLTALKGQEQPVAVALPQSKPQQKPPVPVPVQSQKPIEQKPIPTQNSKLLNLSEFKLSFVKRTPEIQQILNSITKPIDFVDPQKIKKPQSTSISVKYLTQFDKVLDKAISQYSIGDKATKSIVESMQDQLLKIQFQAAKKKQSLSPEQYKLLILASIDTDLKLRRIYKKLGLIDFQNFILARIKVCKEEIGQLLALEEQNPLSFNPDEEKQIFELKQSPAAAAALAKYPQPIQFPQIPQICPCASYIQKMVELSTIPAFKAKFQKAKQQFQNNLNQGTFDQDDYVKKLKNAREQDILRLQLYRKLDLKDYYFFIKARINIMDQELTNF